MISIVRISDTKSIKDSFVKEYILNMIEYFLKEYHTYCANGDISSIGAIFVLESEKELKDYQEFGLTESISNFEWLMKMDKGYVNSCVVIDNDRSINIIGKEEYFNKYLEEIANERNN